MKAILISIKPKYVAKILNGEKTIEIRKTMPKCDLPIDVYIYCTKGEERLVDLRDDSFYCGISKRLNGKVVAKFTLNKVEKFDVRLGHPRIYCKAYVSDTELLENHYHNKDYNAYAWHIDELVIFDEPKELSEFYHYVKYNKEMARLNKQDWDFCPLTKAPQSWCYVEELK